MKRIIVAMDGSEHALKAVEYATEISHRQDETRIELVYVSPPLVLPPNVYAEALARVEADEKQYAAKILGEAAQTVKARGVQCETLHLNGPVAEAIATLADDQKAWMVVVASRGRGAVARVFLGSVADRLVHISKRPVVVVH